MTLLVTTPSFAAPVAGPPAGTPDPTFGGGDGSVDLPVEQVPALEESAVSNVVRAGDGSIRVVWRPEVGAARVSRFSAAGVPDPTFGDEGTVLLDAGPAYLQAAVAADGATFLVLTQGLTSEVLKLDGDGTPDPTFGGDGRAALPSYATGPLRLRAGGALLVATQGGVVALDGTGAPDPSFAYAGPGSPTSLDVLEDGRLVVGAGETNGRVVVLEADGALDAESGDVPGDPGAVSVDVSPEDEGVFQLLARPTGGFMAIVGYDTSVRHAYALALTSSGSRDPAVGADGLIDLAVDPTSSFGPLDWAPGIVDGSDRLTVSVPAPSLFDGEVLRFTPQGTLDLTLDGDGRLYVPGAFYGHLTVSDAGGGSLYLAQTADTPVGYVRRVVEGGDDDPSFSDDGFLALGTPTMVRASTQLGAVQSDGSLVLLSAASIGSPTVTVRRRLPDGADDTAFGDGGAVQIARQEDAGPPTGAAVDGADRIYVTYERALGRWAMLRLLRDGEVDLSFGEQGTVDLPGIDGSATAWFDTSLARDGTVRVLATSLIGGGDGIDPCCDEKLLMGIMLEEDGTRSLAYGDAAGEIRLTGSGWEGPAEAMVQPDGSVILALGRTIRRFDPSGAADPRWSGVSLFGDDTDLGCLDYDFAPWPRGGVLIATFDYRCPTVDLTTTVRALNVTGRPDVLVPDPVTLAGTAGASAFVDVDGTGRPLVTTFGSGGPRLVLLLKDGSPDPTFTPITSPGSTFLEPGMDGRLLRLSSVDPSTLRITRLLPGDPPQPLPIDLTSSALSVQGTYKAIPGDYDGDGTDDIAWYAPGAAADSIWYGRRTGGFVKKPLSINGTYVPVPGDFDGDGRTDLLLYGPGSKPDVLWHSNAPGAFSGSPIQVHGTYRPVPGDFDGDGLGDILWYAPGSGADSIWHGKPTGGFRTSKVNISGTYTPVPGDFSGDGRSDIVFYGPGTASDWLWQAKASGGFTSSRLSIGGTYRPAVGDLNGDELDDVVWYAPGTAKDYAWLSRHGGGHRNQTLALGGSFVPVAGDYNGNGLTDLLWYAAGSTPDRLDTTGIG